MVFEQQMILGLNDRMVQVEVEAEVGLEAGLTKAQTKMRKQNDFFHWQKSPFNEKLDSPKNYFQKKDFRFFVSDIFERWSLKQEW